MSRSMRLGAWFVAVNATCVLGALALTSPASDAARGFMAWCGIG